MARPSAVQMEKASSSVGIRTPAEGGLGTDQAGILEPSLRLSRSTLILKNEGKGSWCKGVTRAKPEGAEQLREGGRSELLRGAIEGRQEGVRYCGLAGVVLSHWQEMKATQLFR